MTKAKAKPEIKLDRSKRFSTVHGDRTPNDPHYAVHFWQAGLPFDVNGNLVPDDSGKELVTDDTFDDGRVIRYKHLWNDAMRTLRDRRTARIGKLQADAEEAAELQEREDLTSDVNLEAWAKGEVQYLSAVLFNAAKARFGKHYTTQAQLLHDLIYEEELIREEEVPDNMRAMLDRIAGKAA